MASPIDFVSGCIGGAAGVLIGHPFDTIKVIMQTSERRLSMMSVVRNCSVASLYRGIKAPLSGLAAINAIVFGVHGSIMRFCPKTVTTDTTESDIRRRHLWWSAIAGCVAGFAQSIVCAPMELVKTRAQIGAQSSSVWHCTRSVWRHEGGLRSGLYRGFWITVARDCPAFTTYFFTYEWLLHLLTERRRRRLQRRKRPSTQPIPPSTTDMLVAGGTAGALSWLIIYPLDVLKSRIQADRRYRTVGECLRDTVNREGFGVLMRGCSPTLMRAFPANGATFAVVTWTLITYEHYYAASGAASGSESAEQRRDVNQLIQE